MWLFPSGSPSSTSSSMPPFLLFPLYPIFPCPPSLHPLSNLPAKPSLSSPLLYLHTYIRRYAQSGLEDARSPFLPLLSIPISRQRNTLNLHRHPLRQLMHRHTAPRRLMRKMLPVFAVHLREIIHRGEEYLDLGFPPRLAFFFRLH